MVPNKGSTVILTEDSEPQLPKLVAPQAEPWKYQILYITVITFLYWHLAAVYGLYLCFTSAKWASIIFAIFLFNMANIGITGGAHRLWSHHSFKAKLPLEILLMIMNSIAYQNTALTWCLGHRLHHRYCDTDGDPHNAARGFFYSHVGWLLVDKHPEVLAREKHIPFDDLLNNPVLKFQKKYAIPFVGTCCFLMPTLVPVYFWGESLSNAWNINMLRYVMNLNAIFCINSAAHLFGNKPYDTSILPRQNLSVSFVTLGEGFHNYHHTYPWDYRAAELGNNKLNMTTLFIDFFAWLGWAYDLKTIPQDVIDKRRAKTGDGTNSWGFGEKKAQTKNVDDDSTETSKDS